MTETLYVAGPVKTSTTEPFMTHVPSDDRRSNYRCNLCSRVEDKGRLSRHIAVEHWGERVPCPSTSCPAFVPSQKSGKGLPCPACTTY